MSKKANPAVIGGFVIGAIVLSIISIILLSGASLFEKKFECIMYFDESISGLDVGAPVDFQGVRIGTVTDVRLVVDIGENVHVLRPVKMQIEGNRIHHADKNFADLDPREGMESLVNINGVRARLASQSLLTGKLKIELDYYPDHPLVRKNRDTELWEMPTIPSPLKKVSEEVAQLPLAEIVNEAYRAIKGLADIMNPERTGETVANLNQSLKRLESVLSRIDGKIDPITEQTAGVMKTISEMLDELKKMLAVMGAHADPLMKSMNSTSENVSKMLDPESPVRGELAILVEDLHETSKSLRRLTDYLEQHPESLLRGKN